MQGCPEAGDDELFTQGLAGACITWALGFHQFMRPLEKMLNEDRTLIALSDRQRYLLYLNSAARTAQECRSMPATATILQAITGKIAELWPEAIEPPYYPAFC